MILHGIVGQGLGHSWVIFQFTSYYFVIYCFRCLPPHPRAASCCRPVGGGRHRGGRPASAVHPAHELREGLGPRLPTPHHQADALLDRGTASPAAAVTRRGAAGDASVRDASGTQRPTRLMAAACTRYTTVPTALRPAQALPRLRQGSDPPKPSPGPHRFCPGQSLPPGTAPCPPTPTLPQPRPDSAPNPLTPLPPASPAPRPGSAPQSWPGSALSQPIQTPSPVPAQALPPQPSPARPDPPPHPPAPSAQAPPPPLLRLHPVRVQTPPPSPGQAAPRPPRAGSAPPACHTACWVLLRGFPLVSRCQNSIHSNM